MITVLSQRIHGMNGIFTYIYQKNHPHVGKYTVHPMDPMGYTLVYMPAIEF